MAKPPVNRPPQNPSNENKGPVSETLISRFIENQGEELKLRKQELEVRSQEAKSNATFAEKSLDAQERDRIDARRHETRMARDRLIFAAIALALIIALSVVALAYGQAEIVKTIVQMLSSLVVGAFGGYFYGKSKNDKPNSDSDH